MIFSANVFREVYDWFRLGHKVIQPMLCSSSVSEIRVGLYIGIENDEEEGRVFGRVTGVFYYQSFEDFFESFSPEKCGFGTRITSKQAVLIMRGKYMKHQEERCGVIGIEVEPESLEEVFWDYISMPD